MDCYKKLIDVWRDPSSTRTGYDAKYFDECDRSGDALVPVHTWDYRDASQDVVKSGTVNPYSGTFCSAMPVFGSGQTTPGALFAGYAYETLGNYFHKKQGVK